MTSSERWLVVRMLSTRLLPWFVGITLYAIVVAIAISIRPDWHIDWGTEAAVVNAVILWFTNKLIEDFAIDSTATLLMAAVLLTIANWIIRFVLF